MSDKYLVVFDTVVLVQSAISPYGAAAQCLDYFERGEILVAVSRPTLSEAKDVLPARTFGNVTHTSQTRRSRIC